MIYSKVTAMKEISFVKSEGSGNDFVIIDELDVGHNISAHEIKLICDRHFGVGGDGVIIARQSAVADFKMVFFNPDGTQAEMCGNGIRCFGKYLYDHGKTTKHEIVVETKSGLKVLTFEVVRGRVVSAKVDMGKPNFITRMVPVEAPLDELIDMPIAIGGIELRGTCLSMGNPHCVIFVDDLDNFPVTEMGPQVESLPIFPEKVNVGFVQILSADTVKLKVWERGAGLTLACGTGACAAVVAAARIKLTNKSAKVELPGGRLDVQWSESGAVYLSGPAKEIFSGKIKI